MTDKSRQPFFVPLLVTIIGGAVVLMIEVFVVSPNRATKNERPIDDTTRSIAHTKLPRSPAGDHPAVLRAVANFSYSSDLSWGPISMGMPRHQLEKSMGGLQCTVEGADGYYCSCRGNHDNVSMLFDLRNVHTFDDPDVCTRPDSELTALTILLTPEERGVSHQELVDVLTGRLPQFRHLRGVEPVVGESRANQKPVYTLADGKYNLVLDYQADAIRVIQ